MNSTLSRLALCVGTCGAAVHAETFSFNPNLDIPDGDLNGTFTTGFVSTSATSWSSLSVSLNIAAVGGAINNGDLYVTLAHESAPNVVDAFVVLLNRPGRTASDSSGYYDSGLQVTFDSAAVGYDVHNYRQHVPTQNGGSDSTPLSGPLTGLWEPDGRNVGADLVLDTTPRTTSLDDFAGINPNGKWVLYLADVFNDSTGSARLVSWSLHSTPVTSVPESSTVVGVVALYLIGLGVWRRKC